MIEKKSLLEDRDSTASLSDVSPIALIVVGRFLLVEGLKHCTETALNANKVRSFDSILNLKR